LHAFLRTRPVHAMPRAGTPSSSAVESPSTTLAARPAEASVFSAWLPWAVLSGVMVLWSWIGLFRKGQIAVPIGALDNAVLITLYDRPYAAVFNFQPLASGTAVLVAMLV